MFRRRPVFRRPIIRPVVVAPLENHPRQLLFQAHQLFDRGEYLAAAEMFERLAIGASNRNMLQRAPTLFLQAARANLRANRLPQAEKNLMSGLEILAATQRWKALRHLGTIAITELNQAGLKDMASRLETWLNKQLEGKPIEETASPFTVPGKPAPKFPEKCPYCGASLKPNEIEWLDQRTVECLYCGSAVATESGSK